MSLLYRDLRLALIHLAEEPPVLLGMTSLASELWPAEQDKLARGRHLRRALHAAIAALRPRGPVDTSDPRWWPYLVAAQEYEQGVYRREVQAGLIISDGAYTRAKRRALAHIDAVLPYVLDEQARTRAVGG